MAPPARASGSRSGTLERVDEKNRGDKSDMVVCAKCGTENAAGRRFCDECGIALAVICPNCGEANRPEAKFCGNCGTGLGGLAVDSLAAGTAQTAGAEGPVSTPAGTLDAPNASGTRAERRLVSVLFADLVGFTPFAEERDPEAVRELLTRYFDMARLAIERHGGTVEKFIGDAVMAVWGAPVAREDDAERAVRAAFEIVDAMTALGPGIEARAGVTTGEAAVTLGATGQGMVAGDLVNTAARLQSVAPPSGVLVGEATMRSASAAVAFELAGPQDLKGKSSPVPAWRALRVVAQRGGQGRGDAPEPPFVGREDELRLLKDVLHATSRERRVRFLSISGPAGIGKSRLAWELEKYIDGVVEQIYWHRGRSPAYGEGIAFWALGEMVRRRAGLAETDDEATTRTRIAAVVGDYVRDAEDRRWVEPALLALLGVEPSPAGGRDALFAGWRIFFENVARRGTAVFLFEDLQWADSGLLDFIDHLLDWSKGAPILIITLARPELFERRPEWGAGMRHVTAITLDPLPEEAMRALLAGFVPGLPEPTVAAILRRADGIPLYAVETVRMLVADGRMEPVDGVYRPIGDLGALSVPETLRSLIGARLDALEPADRALLQHASVLGRTFSPAVLAAIAAASEPELEPRLRALMRRELLELEADPRSPERGQYRFVQSLIREVAYDTLARRDRRARHLAAARYFEALGDDELAGVLSAHFLAAYHASAEGPEADTLAVQTRLTLRAAADRAANLGGQEQAVAYLEEALAVTIDPSERADLLERAATSADAAAQNDAAVVYAQGAIDAYREAGDPLSVSRATASLGEILIDAGDLAGAVRVLEGALQTLPAGEGSGTVEAGLLASLSRAMFRSNEAQQAVDVADRALAQADLLSLDRVFVEALLNRGTGMHYLGRRREAGVLLEAAVRFADSGGWISTELRARHNLAYLLFPDEPARALEIAQDGLALARRVGNRYLATWLTVLEAHLSFLLGAGWDAVLASLEEAASATASPTDRSRMLGCMLLLRAARGEPLGDIIEPVDAATAEVSDPQIVSELEGHLSEAALIGGDSVAAYDLALRATERYPAVAEIVAHTAVRAAAWAGDADRCRAAAERVEQLHLSGALFQAHRVWAWAAVAALEGRPDEARTGFHDALGRFRDLGFEFQLARTALDMVLLLGPDEPEAQTVEPAAQAAVEEARRIFEQLRARPYVAKLDQALSAGRGPATASPSATAGAGSSAPTESAAGTEPESAAPGPAHR
jgi:class 3 adenylate cyclase/tetratricopeptide (TPR) repeat protein